MEDFFYAEVACCALSSCLLPVRWMRGMYCRALLLSGRGCPGFLLFSAPVWWCVLMQFKKHASKPGTVGLFGIFDGTAGMSLPHPPHFAACCSRALSCLALPFNDGCWS